MGAAFGQMWGDGAERRKSADGEAEQQEEEVLGQYEPGEPPGAKAQGTQQRQLAAPFPDGTQQHQGEPERAQGEAEAAESLERRQVHVLDGGVCLETLAAGLDGEAELAEALLQGLLDLLELMGRPAAEVDEREVEAFVARIELQE